MIEGFWTLLICFFSLGCIGSACSKNTCVLLLSDPCLWLVFGSRKDGGPTKSHTGRAAWWICTDAPRCSISTYRILLHDIHEHVCRNTEDNMNLNVCRRFIRRIASSWRCSVRNLTYTSCVCQHGLFTAALWRWNGWAGRAMIPHVICFNNHFHGLNHQLQSACRVVFPISLGFMIC